ncbi:MAG TPA: hypothetical protein VFI29_15445 [Hanamia sp.]|nr:hypothetical protein [Hanamia sp.]
MAVQKKGFIIYKRDKNKVEISGDTENVKWPIWFDMISSVLKWLIPLILLFVMDLVTVPKENILPILLKCIKHIASFLTLFVVVAGWTQVFFIRILFISGSAM